MEKYFVAIDDSKALLNQMQDLFKQHFPHIRLDAFQQSEEALLQLQQGDSKPSLIFCDLIMPDLDGKMLLDRLKRNVKTHSIPFILMSGELEPETKINLEKNGVFHFINKPLQLNELKEAIDRALKQALDPKDLKELDQGFAEDSLDQLEQAKKTIGLKSDADAKEWYRIYHTLKGGARSLQFPQLGSFVHLLEDVLTAIQKGAVYGHPTITKALDEANDYLLLQLSKIKEEKTLEPPRQSFMETLKLIKLNLDAGWLVGKGNESVRVSNDEKNEIEEKKVDSPISTSVRISNQKMDDLQNRFKKLQQIRVKLNAFAQELKREFTDEGFPNQLIQLVSSMEQESMAIMDFFISLRVIPANRLKTFATQTVKQASDLLKKNVELHFSTEEGIEIDQSIIEVLETALTHLIRNSIDHGIETPTTRIELGKPEAGQIKIEIVKDLRERFIMRIQDDGAGIPLKKMRELVAKKGLMSEETLRSIPDEKVCDFIFLDGLSTKTSVSELSGRGVGLSAVKDRIQQLGGSIDTKTKPNEGTLFEIKLPRVFQL